jgi:hypothetical protein
MNTVPMRPWQNALAIVAGFLVAGTLLPWPSRYRLACALGAAALVLVLFAARLSAHAKQRSSRSSDDALSRIERIRAERDARTRRR